MKKVLLILPIVAHRPGKWGKGKNHAAKRKQRILKNTNILKMSADFKVLSSQIENAILNPGNNSEINTLWQAKLPLSERCENIKNRILPLGNKEWDTVQKAGVSMLAKALYLYPASIVDMAKHRSGDQYLKEFLGAENADATNFHLLLEDARKDFMTSGLGTH
jgi:hypothetical protein